MSLKEHAYLKIGDTHPFTLARSEMGKLFKTGS